MIRVTFTKVIDGRVRTFEADGREGESFAGREFMQQFGFASFPKDGATGVIVYNGNFIIAIASDDSSCRPELQEGETVVYDANGNTVHLTADGITAVSPKKITAQAPDIELTGKVKITGSLEVTEDITAAQVSDSEGSMEEIRTKHNLHIHDDSTSAPTTPPLEPM